MKNEDLIIYAATYPSLDDAKLDMATLRDLAIVGDLRKLTAVTIAKDEKGRLHIHEKTQQGRDDAWFGVTAGLILGAVFPPAGLAILSGAIAGAVSLGVIGGAIGHFAGGVSRKDMREIGDMLDDGEAAIVAVAVDAIATDVDNALAHALKKAKKQMAKGHVDAAIADLQKGLDNAEIVEERAI